MLRFVLFFQQFYKRVTLSRIKLYKMSYPRDKKKYLASQESIHYFIVLMTGWILFPFPILFLSKDFVPSGYLVEISYFNVFFDKNQKPLLSKRRQKWKEVVQIE